MANGYGNRNYGGYRNKGYVYNRGYSNKTYSGSGQSRSKGRSPDGTVKSQWITKVEEREGKFGKYFLVTTKKYKYFVPAEDQNTVTALVNRVEAEYEAVEGKLIFRGKTGPGNHSYEVVAQSTPQQAPQPQQNTPQDNNITRPAPEEALKGDMEWVDKSKARVLLARIEEDIQTLRKMLS